jgi:hypothetical protein
MQECLFAGIHLNIFLKHNRFVALEFKICLNDQIYISYEIHNKFKICMQKISKTQFPYRIPTFYVSVALHDFNVANI